MKTSIHVLYPAEYSASYAIKVDANTSVTSILEQVFEAWNNGSGHECIQFINSRKRSMSVGDFVGVNGNYYKCDAYGWTGVNWNQIVDFEAKVTAHDDYKHHGAWFAVQRLLENRLIEA